ncbi:MAG: hypothetical protein HYX68_02485 [Planctomycetes bacterium]|nr:hypothetical protein [Planctomycetota bacterium]
MAGLLVSVRSVAEARSALTGGAALIDVKEPAHGALGRAADETVRAIVEVVALQRPVSAALGEWSDGCHAIPDCALTYFKFGLAGCDRDASWRHELGSLLGAHHSPQLVLAAYADWQCARAPSVDEVFALACAHPGSVLLLDTHCKDANNPLRKARPTLLDWLPIPWIEDLCARSRSAGVRIALAGSLGRAEIRALLPARPDWFAVRGAVCADGDRQAVIVADKVRTLADLVRG